jgi:polysaccharide export outer membrane protein
MKTNKVLNLIFILVIAPAILWSQQQQQQQIPRSQQPQQVQTPTEVDISGYEFLRPMFSAMYTDQVLEGPVNPEYYIVGPNDIFSLGIWGIMNSTVPINVTPEGTLIVPTIGEIPVAGLTLSEVKQKVIEKVKRRYISADVSLTLVSPRRFTITVTGVGQGEYPMSAALRAGSIIAQVLYDTTALVRSGTTKGERYRFSLRNITLSRKDGSTSRIDLLKYYATHDDKYNPYLREGDIINIPKYDYDGRFLSVFGAVQFPGAFEWMEGDDLETAIQLARGFTTSAQRDSILISRLDMNSKNMTNVFVKYDENKHMPIQINDRVVVMTYTDWRRDYRVTVLGEVIRPGPYPITLNTTKLSDIINQASGFTSNAYLPTSELYRRLDTMFMTNTKSLRDSAEYLFTQRLNDVISNDKEREQFEIDTKGRIGRVNVDFVRLFEKNDLSQDVILKEGDVIYISPNNGAVYIYGQVNKPGFVQYVEGKDFDYYVEKAGGFGDRANEDNARVIKFKTREWLEPDEAKIEANDFIYVPKVIKRDFAYDIDLIAKVAGVVSAIITLTLLIIQIQK